MHQQIEELLEMSSDIKVQIIFLTTGAEEDKVTLLVQHLLALDPVVFPQVISEWFRGRTYNYEKWSKKFPVEVDLNSFKQLTLDHGLYCWHKGLTYSPILFMNGNRVPDVYEPRNLHLYF